MEDRTRFLDCPAYVGHNPTARCGLPAELEAEYLVGSTDGPLECARIRCPRGHWFNGPIESLAIPQPPAEPGVSARPLTPPYLRSHAAALAKDAGLATARQGRRADADSAHFERL
jgi:hypothetical protein